MLLWKKIVKVRWFPTDVPMTKLQFGIFIFSSLFQEIFLTHRFLIHFLVDRHAYFVARRIHILPKVRSIPCLVVPHTIFIDHFKTILSKIALEVRQQIQNGGNMFIL